MESLAVVEMTIPNILAERYASEEMRQIWDPKNKIIEERKLWIAVMKAQSKLGLNIKESDIQRYQDVLEIVDLDSIKNREKTTRHDVKARIEEFNALAGLELIHIGMTSRDLTENVELVQIFHSMRLIERQGITLLSLLAEKAEKYSDLSMVGRSHNVPAQLTTLGKKFATLGEELIIALENLHNILERFALKGIKGPMGTAQDLLEIVKSGEGHYEFENTLLESTEINHLLGSTGQIYPRSIDFEVVAALVQLSASPSNLATNIRLMAGHGIVSEKFAEGQVGSSAMPHKMNPRISERVNGLAIVLRGYLYMLDQLSGNQWNEGDVSCSVVRRIALPDAFFAIDALLQNAMVVLMDLNVSTSAISREVKEQLPFLLTSKLLMEAVKKGRGREEMHQIIKKHSIKAINDLGQTGSHSMLEDLASDPEFPLTRDEIEVHFHSEKEFTGLAPQQSRDFAIRVRGMIDERPKFRYFSPVVVN